MNLAQLIVLALSLSLVTSTCLPDSHLANLESGLIDASATSQMLLLSASGQTKYIYQFKTQFNNSPQTALSLSFFDGNPIGGFGFSVSANSSNTAMQISLSIPTPLIKWTQLRFTFIASSRIDIQLGQHLVQNWNQNQKVTAVKFDKVVSDVAAFAARAFLTGIQIPLIIGNLSVQVSGLVFNNTTFTVGVSSSSIIKSVSVSYILFPISSQSFAFSAGIFAQESISGTFYQNAQGSLNSFNYYIYGIVGFELEKNQFSLSSSLSDTYLLSVTGKAKNVVISYLSLGISPSVSCQKCDAKYTMYRYGCVNSCENGMSVYNFSNITKGCVMCQPAAGFKSSSSGCVCGEDKINIRNSCVDKTKVQNANLSASEMQSNFFKKLAETTPQTGVTFALSDQAYALGATQCNDPNSYYTGSVCVCRPGYYQISGKCSQCLFSSYYNGNDCIDTRTGLPTGQNSAISQISFNVNGNMQTFGQSKSQVIYAANTNGAYQQSQQLPPGAVPHNTVFSQGINSVSSGNNVDLLSFNTQQQNYANSGSFIEGALPHGAYLADGTNVGQSTTGFQSQFTNTNNYYDNSRGVLSRQQSSTSPNSLQYFLSSMLTSSSTSSSFNDASFFFPAGMIPCGSSSLSELTQSSFFTAGSTCPQNEYLSSNNVCTCIPGYARNSDRACGASLSVGFLSTSLTLSDITLIVAPNRTQCNSAYSYVTPDDCCTCRVGYAFNTNYVCFPIPSGMNCAQGSILYSNSTCACPRDFFNNSGVCQTCPPYHYYNGSICIANCPANSVYSSINRNCTCSQGYVTVAPNICAACPAGSISYNNICVSCPINSRLVNGQCQCVSGTIFTSGSCISSCPIQTYYDTILRKCLCVQPNYFVDTSNNCVSCPLGQYYDGQTCIPCSGINSYFDVNTRTCRYCPAPGFVSRGECVRCPDGTDWSSSFRRCICISSTLSAPFYCQGPGVITLAGLPSCNNPSSTCPINGYLINDICVICPINSQLINGQCTCNIGYINSTVNNPTGVCVQSCQSGYVTNGGLCVTCPPNSNWQVSTQSCICQQGYAPSGGACVRSCGIAAELDQNGYCSCLPGYFPLEDAAGNCAICSTGCRICSSQSLCNLCQEGYALILNQCVRLQGSVLGASTTTSGSSTFGSTSTTNNIATTNIVSNTLSTNTYVTNAVTTVGSQSICTIINCQTCPTAPSICTSCIINYSLYNGQCVNSSLLARAGISVNGGSSTPTSTSTTTTSSSSGSGGLVVSGICLNGCPRGYVCNAASTCVIATATASSGSYSSSSSLSAQQQAQLLFLQQQQALTSSASISSNSGQSISISNIVSGIASASFTATVSPTPRTITFQYPSLQSFQYPSGVCMRTGDTNLWRCQISYQNQPISTDYSVILTANGDTGQWSTTFTVKPIRSNI